MLTPEEQERYVKVSDTLDVWFDSGSTSFTVVDKRSEYNGSSADMYLEGSDQHRGWFMSSLMLSTAIKNEAPYKTVLTHGFTVDAQGRKMSKSIGNVVSPQDVIAKMGADVLRLWVASTDYTGDMTVSDEIFKRSADAYRRIRNTMRFLLANLKGFDPADNLVPLDKMVALDRWAVACAAKFQQEIIKAYDDFDFHTVVQKIMEFCSVEMGSFYLDIIKDRQYTAKADSLARRSCQSALYHIAEALVRWMAPVLSFTAQETWSFMPGKRDKYVFTAEWYEGLAALPQDAVFNDAFWHEVKQVRDEVYKERRFWIVWKTSLFMCSLFPIALFVPLPRSLLRPRMLILPVLPLRCGTAQPESAPAAGILRIPWAPFPVMRMSAPAASPILTAPGKSVSLPDVPAVIL